MQTLSIGVDIIENSRIKKSINNKKFLGRIFSKQEISRSKKIQADYKAWQSPGRIIRDSGGERRKFKNQNQLRRFEKYTIRIAVFLYSRDSSVLRWRSLHQSIHYSLVQNWLGRI